MPANALVQTRIDADIRDRHWTFAGVEILPRVDADGGADRRVQIGNRNGAADDCHGEVVGLANCLASLEAAAGQRDRE